jgi:putative transposase
MHRIDALHLEHPFAGSRMLRDLLRAEGVVIGRVAVATLMRRMGIEALYRRPNTSKPAPGHKIYPYLLRDLVINRPNQVWAMDITCPGQCPEPHGARLRLSDRSAGLVQPTGAGWAAVDHAGGGVLPRRGAGQRHCRCRAHYEAVFRIPGRACLQPGIRMRLGAGTG